MRGWLLLLLIPSRPRPLGTPHPGRAAQREQKLARRGAWEWGWGAPHAAGPALAWHAASLRGCLTTLPGAANKGCAAGCAHPAAVRTWPKCMAVGGTPPPSSQGQHACTLARHGEHHQCLVSHLSLSLSHTHTHLGSLYRRRRVFVKQCWHCRSILVPWRTIFEFGGRQRT